MIAEELTRPTKKSAKINFILMRGNHRPYFLSLLLIISSLFILSTVPAFAIRLINARMIFEINQQLNKPSDVSVSRDGLIYVVDGVNNKIKIFDQKGRFVSSFGKQGSGRGEFSQPLGIDLDKGGKVYIADSGNQRVQIFSATGGFVNEIKLPASNGHGADPTDVAIDNVNNKCYISDNDNHRILAYDLVKLTLIAIYGGRGSGRDRFRYPFLMALGKEQQLYVVDVINTRVQVLNSQGSFEGEIGGWGVEKGEFFRPKGVAVDGNNRVYVSDSYLGVIQVFEASGDFYGALGNPATAKVKKFRTPMGLFVDQKNRLYVVETLANKVGVYQLEGVTE